MDEEKERLRLANRIKQQTWRARHPGLAVKRAAEWAKNNPEKRKEQVRKYYQKHRTEKAAYCKKWHEENRAKNLARKAAWRKANIASVKEYNSNWKKLNPHKVVACTVKRQAQQLKATPSWANELFIEEAYRLASLRTKATGYKWHVDHIVPLRSKFVCGLHVEHNLQVIPATQNVAKSNLSWPDMPEPIHHG